MQSQWQPLQRFTFNLKNKIFTTRLYENNLTNLKYSHTTQPSVVSNQGHDVHYTDHHMHNPSIIPYIRIIMPAEWIRAFMSSCMCAILASYEKFKSPPSVLLQTRKLWGRIMQVRVITATFLPNKQLLTTTKKQFWQIKSCKRKLIKEYILYRDT